jgi:hypothetical protein
VFVALASAALVGCSPAPEPTPTPTAAFASEEEAFAAAEETYRAYIDATNAEQRGDENVASHRFLTGALLEAEMETDRELETAGIRIRGETVVESFVGVSVSEGSTAKIEADVCLDISDARAIDAAGNDVTAPGRSDVYGVTVAFVGSSTSLLVSEYEVKANARCSS